MTALRRANLALLGLLVAHTADHLARHPGGHRRVSVNNWVGAAALYASVATAFALADREDPRAPLASVAAGLFSFAGPLLAHSTSRLGRFSQPYRRGHADAFSWALLLGVAAAGAGVGVAGIRAKCTGPDGTRREGARCVT